MQCACGTLSSVACLALQYVSTLSHKRHDFREKKLLNIKCVFSFYLQLLSDTFFITRRTEQYVIKNVYPSSCKVPVILFIYINETWMFSAEFQKIHKYQTLWKSSIESRVISCRQTDGHDETNSRFSQFFGRACKREMNIRLCRFSRYYSTKM